MKGSQDVKGWVLIIAALFAAFPASAQDEDDPVEQAVRLLRDAIDCPIVTWYDTNCKPGGYCFLSHKVEQTYTGDSKVLEWESMVELTRTTKDYSTGITTTHMPTGFKVGYRNLAYRDVSIGPTPQGKQRRWISIQCRSGKCITEWEGKEDNKRQTKNTGFPVCNENAAEDAKRAIQILIKVNSK
jgi:hypothetical protein